MAFNIVRQDLSAIAADAVVLPSNEHLIISGGAGASVARAAGLDELRAALAEIGHCKVGQAVATPGFDAAAEYLIHAVGPIWQGGDQAERDLLERAYLSSLRLAHDLGAKSIAMPLLSTGAFGYPVREAFEVALSAIKEFLETADMEITLVVFNKEAVLEGYRRYGEIAEYIDDAQAEEVAFDACFASTPLAAPVPSAYFEPEEAIANDVCFAPAPMSPVQRGMAGGEADLRDVLAGLDAPFSDLLFALIDARGMSDAEVYKRANMSRQLFSKIRSSIDYRPSKRTVLALAIALKLTLDETEELLERAGFALSHASKADVIVEYFISRGIYDIFAVNEALYAFDQPLL